MKKFSLFFLSLFILAACGDARSNSHDSAAVSSTGTGTETAAADTAPAKSNARPITMAFVGDIMMGTTYPENGKYLTADDGKSIFKDAKEILSRADIAAGNLEGSLFDGKGSVKKCSNPSSCFAFRQPSRYAKHLVDAGFDFVGIANNHINDFGPEAVASTKKTLTDNGIAFAGLRDGCPTAIVEKDGMKIGFAAFGHSRGTASIMDYEEVKRNVKSLRGKCDIVVVSFHGGGEGQGFQHVPHKMESAFGEQRGDVEKFAHTAVDAGADIVFGHGPHVNRALELYKDHLIIYSLGNFATPYRMGLSGVSGYAPIVEATLNPDGTFESGQIHSFIQQKGVGPRKDATNAVARNMAKLTKADFPNTPLEISDEGKISKKK